MWRFIALLVVALGLAPGTWWRTPLPAAPGQSIVFTPLPVAATDIGPLEFAGAWQLDSANDHFGSYSALIALGDGTLLAASDRGRMLRFAAPGAPAHPTRFDYFANRRQPRNRLADIEALARDPASGEIWVAFEVSNRIERHDAALRPTGSASPAAMHDWRSAFGAEAMVRLADGRFIVLAEGSAEWFGDGMPGLLFPADPVAGARPVHFHFAPPPGFRPVEMAQLPDRRVLILLRRVDFGVPPAFSVRLVLADPATIRAGKPWRTEFVADLAPPLPADNYEALAVEPDSEGGVVLWLMSDDNQMALQRTLLLKLAWPAEARARGNARAAR